MNLAQNPQNTAQQQVLDALPVLVLIERSGKVVFANAEVRHLLGRDEGEWIPAATEELIWGLGAGTAEPHTRLSDHGRARPFHATLPTAKGRILSIEGVYCPGDEEDPETALIIAHPASHERAPRTRLMEDVLACIPEAVALVHGKHVLYVNAAFTRIFGYTSDEACGSSLFDLTVPETRRKESLEMRKAVDEQGWAQIDTVRLTKSGDLIDVALQVAPLNVGGQRAGYIFSYRDIGDRKQIEAKLQHDALHDPLTGLPNRALFLDRLRLALSRRARRNDLGCAVMFIDLDRFKEINDTLGHAAGDELLMRVAERLRAAVRPHDTAARLGGDEFAVLLENLPSLKELEIVANRIQSEMDRPFEIYDHPLETGASIGVAMASDEHKAPELLIRDADFAMYRAKQRGGGRFEIFDKRMELFASNPREREQELRQVLDKHLFEFWYQPICRLANGRIEGFEALLRRRHTDGTVESFRNLLPVAEETGLSISLGRESLESICRQSRMWMETMPWIELSLTANLSERQFYHPDLVTQVKRALAATGADPARLLVEVDEATLNNNSGAAALILQRLADCNIRLAVDNFGAGLAPLNHLVGLPIDVLKLAPVLTASATRAGRQVAVLEALIRLGRTLGVQVIAQGIETHEQMRALSTLGCELGQGYLFSPAVAPEQAQKMAAEGGWIPTNPEKQHDTTPPV